MPVKLLKLTITSESARFSTYIYGNFGLPRFRLQRRLLLLHEALSEHSFQGSFSLHTLARLKPVGFGLVGVEAIQPVRLRRKMIGFMALGRWQKDPKFLSQSCGGGIDTYYSNDHGKEHCGCRKRNKYAVTKQCSR